MANAFSETPDKEGHPVPDDAKQELARLDRALKTLSAGYRTLLQASDEESLLRDMCRVIVASGYFRATAGYAVFDSKKSIRLVESAGISDGAVETTEFTWADTDLGQTAIGTAIRTGQVVAGRKLLTDPAYASPVFQALRDEARNHGYTAVAAFPIHFEGKILGSLAIVATDANAFDAKEMELLGQLISNLDFGIANLRSRAAKREAEATIKRLAYYDQLTGLPNRTLLFDLLHETIEAATPQGQSLALLYVGVGRYREINKVLGHRAGDALLQELCQRLAARVQNNQSLARVGEADFALMVPNGTADDVVQIAHQLQETMLAPVMVHGLLLDAQACIGIAMFPRHATDAHALIRRANAAMQQAQPISGGFAIYTGGQEEENTRRLALMGDLNWALAHSGLSLYYQPKVEIASRRVCGAEALVRWVHPLHGMVSTQELISLVEQAGMIRPLTNWVLEAAFRQNRAWQEAGLNLSIAVNLSVQDLYDRGLVDRIRGLFSASGIAPELMQFELTESALMADPSGAVDTLTNLKKLNVNVFVDDFGTGYSSLSYLQQLPVDGLKIDRSFVTPMAIRGDSAVIVKSTIELGHNLGLKIVAEGVESEDVWKRLGALDCDLAQGFLISRPIPAQQLTEWTRAWA